MGEREEMSKECHCTCQHSGPRDTFKKPWLGENEFICPECGKFFGSRLTGEVDILDGFVGMPARTEPKTEYFEYPSWTLTLPEPKVVK